MLIDNIYVEAQEGVTEEEIAEVVAQEKAIWNQNKKVLGQIEISIDGDELVVIAVERSPIKRVRRITGYLSTEDRFNDAKRAEMKNRIAHI